VNGGSLGTEASVLMYPLFVVAFIYVALRFPANRILQPLEKRLVV
jgi:ABC-type amino acid transport system permease subunit